MENNYENIERFHPDLDVGLTSEQVKTRKKQNLVNSDNQLYHKSLAAIIFGNIFTFYNVIYYIWIGVMAAFLNALFALAILLVIPNIVLGMVHDLKVRKIAKENIRTHKAIVIRDGNEIEIPSNEIVLDDIVVVKEKTRVFVDGLVRFGNIHVNEGTINGRSNSIPKGVEDTVYSESFVTSGYAKIQASAVGNNKSIEDIHAKTRKIKRSNASIMHSLQVMFLIVTLLAALVVLINVIINKESLSDLKLSINSNGTMFILMLPIGVFFITSLAYLFSSIKLNKKCINIQSYAALETLSRANVVCFDKTGTITDANLRVKTIESLGDYSQDQITQALINVLEATKDFNVTANAIRKYVKFEPTLTATASLPFTSENKYSGASFGTKGTYILGAIDKLKMPNKAAIVYRAEEYTKNGYAVLCLGKSLQQIKGTSFTEQLEPIALIVLEDSVRTNMVDILKYLKDKNIDVKVISGDSARTTCEVAKSAGVQNAEQYISLVNATEEEVRRFAHEYTVFGDATPEQKEMIISSLKKGGKNIAMIGDGINDVLALKSANCSIAIGGGNEAARNVAQLILEDSDTSKLKELIEEGERVTQNLWGVSSLFLSKSIFMILFFALMIIVPLINKEIKLFYLPMNFVIWEIFTLLASFSLIFLNKSKKKREKSFVAPTLITSLVSGLIMALFVVTYVVLYSLRLNHTIYLDLSLVESSSAIAQNVTVGHIQIHAMIIISVNAFALATFFRVCNPFDKARKLIFGFGAVLFVLALGAEVALSILNKGEQIFIATAFNLVTPYQWAFSMMLLVIVFAIYVFIIVVVEYVRGKKNENSN